MHFEELWEECEKLHKDLDKETSSEILNELIHKCKVYDAINSTSLEEEDKLPAKEVICGIILFSLTKLSAKDNINVYKVLKDTAARERWK